MAISLDGLMDLQAQVEQCAARSDLPPADRVALLRSLRRDISELLGRIDTYIGDLELERESEALSQSLDALRARENATLREEMLRRDLATAEELDEMGYLSHEELDRLTEEGLLEAALVGMARKWDEALHPRGRGGRFVKVFGGGVEPPSQAKPSAAPPVDKAEADRLYRERRVKLEARIKKRVSAEVEKARERLHAGTATPRTGTASTADLTDAEIHLNRTGKMSQHTLGRYARDATTQPTTLDMHSKMVNGKRVWTPERKKLHEEIVDKYLRRMKEDGKGGWEFDAQGEMHKSVENPEVLFSGGGYAAGKSSILKILRAEGREPDSGYEGPVLTLDPDQIKGMLPEFIDTAETDPEANVRTYEEAWIIAQEVQRRAIEYRMNIVVDGISDTSPDEMVGRAQAFIKKGYKARAVYVDIPTDEALRRAAHRARSAKNVADKRMIPEVVLRAVHRDVAATVPDLIDRLQNFDIPLAVEVWDNDQGKDSAGGFRPPKRFASREPGGALVVEQNDLWERFKTKADEEIVGVDAPADTVSVGLTPYRPEDKFSQIVSLAQAGDLPEAIAATQSLGPLSEKDREALRAQMESSGVPPTSVAAVTKPESFEPGIKFEAEDFYHSHKFRQFEKALDVAAKKHGVTIASKERAEGIWEGETEPSYAVQVHDGPDGVSAWAEEMRAAFDQDGVLLFQPSEDGPDVAFSLKGVSDKEAALKTMREVGISAGRFQGDTLEIIAPGVGEGQPTPGADTDTDLSTRSTAEDMSAKIEELRKAIGIDDVEFVRGNFQIVERPSE